MYYVTKRLEISAAHSLMLSYESKCESLHGHNWTVQVFIRASRLDEIGIAADFTVVKRELTAILAGFDHKNLNDVLPVNPTAENIARWICDHVENAYRVEVWESEMNMAAYEKD